MITVTSYINDCDLLNFHYVSELDLLSEIVTTKILNAFPFTLHRNHSVKLLTVNIPLDKYIQFLAHGLIKQN